MDIYLTDKRKGFTLLELLIVLAILAVLAVILLIVVRPQVIFQRTRDARRKTDLLKMSQAIDIYLSDIAQSGGIANLSANYTTPNWGCLNGAGGPTNQTLYYGSKDTTNPDVPLGWTGITRATTTRTIDGNGWLPVNLASLGASSALNFPNYPLDPSNTFSNTKPGYYYTYGCNASNKTWELNANMEQDTTSESNDGGNNPYVYEVGPDKTILPAGTSSSFYQQ
jgi:prepilin-type N-terminal cleavage/methylation domain-containing protein